MFAWTVGTILAALDAGIASVSAVYNRQYTNGVALYGPAHGAAHAHAVRAALIELRTADSYRAIVAESNAVDAVLSTLVAA